MSKLNFELLSELIESDSPIFLFIFSSGKELYTTRYNSTIRNAKQEGLTIAIIIEI